jgi:hypothetical protein
MFVVEGCMSGRLVAYSGTPNIYPKKGLMHIGLLCGHARYLGVERRKRHDCKLGCVTGADMARPR